MKLFIALGLLSLTACGGWDQHGSFVDQEMRGSVCTVEMVSGKRADMPGGPTFMQCETDPYAEPTPETGTQR